MTVKKPIISSSIISFILTLLMAGAYAVATFGYKFWPTSIIYGIKSFVFYGLFTDKFALTDSYWFWGAFISLTFVIVFARLNDEAKRDYAARRYREIEASRNTQVYCSKCDQYLGNGLDYDMPCPRCGSNRYTLKSAE